MATENIQNNGNATETGAQGQEQNQAQQNQGAIIDYDKIQSMINSRTERAENAVLNSYFEQQGITGDEAKQAIEAFKSQKAQNATNLAEENKQLKAQILQGKVDTAISKAATDLGISAQNIPYVTKLADLKNATNDKGEVDDKAISEALKKVLEDVPAFKSTEQNTGFQIGGNGSDTEKTDDSDKRLRAAFGLK